MYLKEFVRLDKLDTIQALRDFVEHTAREITSEHYEQTKNKQSSIINRVESIIHSNLHNSQLTLYGVASEMLYMNADYLGKLFKKETGERFSNYVMKARMEKAIELIGEMDDVKVFELAELLGFGDNPQYFSQVFKKHTGFTPSEFKRSPS
jgi:two-component system response regulator YesN